MIRLLRRNEASAPARRLGRVIGLLTVLTFLLRPEAAPAFTMAAFKAKVVGVADGDTLTVLRDTTQVRIRLHGMDAPEKGQPFGNRAKQYASELAFGKVVTVEPTDQDQYGRVVADVILPDARNLNRELVRAGLAWWYRRYARDDGELARLEAEARNAHRGLWAEPHPVPPWEWRGRRATTRTPAAPVSPVP